MGAAICWARLLGLTGRGVAIARQLHVENELAASHEHHFGAGQVKTMMLIFMVFNLSIIKPLGLQISNRCNGVVSHQAT